MPRIGKRGVDYIGVGVGAVLVDERGEVLLLRRRLPPEAGTWSIPGGAVEWNEHCIDAVVRECREEVGVRVEVVRLLTVVDHIVREDRSHWVSLEYLATIADGERIAVAPDENLASRWFSLDELPDNLSQIAREALQAYRSTS